MRKIPFGKPILGEREKRAVDAVMASGMLVHGRRIVEFEEAFAEFTGAPVAVGTSSCTAAMHLAYFHLGIGAGDEVIVPAMTHVATAHAVELTGARAVFVDVEERTGNIDLDALEGAITDRTRAVCVVHYLGLPVRMERVVEIARRHDLFVVEDCALSLGATYQGVHTGLHGDVGCFSFYPVKHITSAEGGMIITRDAGLGDALRLKRAFGVDRHFGERPLPGVYNVVELGFNYRMSEIHAAIGREQMGRLPGFLELRAENYRTLTDGLRAIEGIELLDSTAGDLVSSYYCQAVVLDESLAAQRFAIIEKLKARGIGTSIYYPHPVPAMDHYHRKYGHVDSDFPGAARLANRSIALPVGPHLDAGDMSYVAATLADVIRQES